MEGKSFWWNVLVCFTMFVVEYLTNSIYCQRQVGQRCTVSDESTYVSSTKIPLKIMATNTKTPILLFNSSTLIYLFKATHYLTDTKMHLLVKDLQIWNWLSKLGLILVKQVYNNSVKTQESLTLRGVNVDENDCFSLRTCLATER